MISFDRFLDWRGITLSGLSTWLIRNLSTPATGLLTLILAESLAQFTWDFFWTPPTQPLPPARLSTVMQTHTTQGPSVDTVLQTHLFGKTKVAEVAKITPVPVASVPVPTRNLTSETSEAAIKFTLRGIMAGDPPSAILSWPGESDRFLQVDGRNLPDGSVIQKIQVDQVILSRGGKLTTLSLGRQLIPNFFGWNIGKNERKRDRREETQNSVSNKVSLNQYRSRILENPNTLEKIVRTQPIYKSGRLEGFRLRPGPEGEQLFDQYGLQPNDLLTSLNGIPLDDPLKAIQVLQSMRDASEIDLGVVRKGRAAIVKLQFSRK